RRLRQAALASPAGPAPTISAGSTCVFSAGALDIAADHTRPRKSVASRAPRSVGAIIALEILADRRRSPRAITLALPLHNGVHMTYSRKTLTSFLFLSLAAIAGCDGGEFPTQPGDSVVTDGTTSFAVTSSGGGLVERGVPQGAACDPQVWTFTVHIASEQFAWETCTVTGDAADPASYTITAGSRALRPGQIDSVLTT